MPDTLYRIYIDDSGNVDPVANNDHNVRYGSITAVLLKAEYLDTKFNSSFQTLIDKHFGKGTEESPRTVLPLVFCYDQGAKMIIVLGSKLINLYGLLVKCEIPAGPIANPANFIAVPDPQRRTSET
jgi:hypothetical protein